MLRSDEVAGARLEAAIDGAVHEILTDDEGYFHIVVDASMTHGWRDIPLRLLRPGEGSAVAEVLVPPPDARFGVISDLDDTVVQTGATKLTSMLRATLLENAGTRLPFEGIAGFYRALHAERNPIFYVSSGPWNFYEVYREFLETRGIPRGPILLGDFGLDEETLIHQPHIEHKLRSIRSIFDEYPHLKFVLIGDSGQRDPEVYREVVKEYPGRVLAVYIRDVSVEERDRIVVEIGEGLRSSNVDLVLTEETSRAVDHAKGLGLI
jgi:phosphatidate phosphatase APP1